MNCRDCTQPFNTHTLRDGHRRCPGTNNILNLSAEDRAYLKDRNIPHVD